MLTQPRDSVCVRARDRAFVPTHGQTLFIMFVVQWCGVVCITFFVQCCVVSCDVQYVLCSVVCGVVYIMFFVQ